MTKIPLPPPGSTPRTFWLYRKVDSSGVSGTGYVAVGVILPTGQTVLEWMVGDHKSIEIHNSLDSVIAIHGHGGSTIVIDILSIPDE